MFVPRDNVRVQDYFSTIIVFLLFCAGFWLLSVALFAPCFANIKPKNRNMRVSSECAACASPSMFSAIPLDATSRLCHAAQTQLDR